MNNRELPITYLNGVLLGVNAIRDSYLWVDSPDCFFFKVDHIQGNHDLNSCLRRANGQHKVLATISDVDNVIGNRNDVIENTLYEMAKKDFVKQIFVSSMPMNQLVGFDYNGMVANVQDKVNKPIFNIASRSMTSCWLDGYSDLLFSLAKSINIDGKKKKEKHVSIVGNLFDRNEGDCIGNVEELKNIFEGLGLSVSSIWLDGGDYEDLLKIKDSETIISLPYGRKAAKKIAKRLGVDLLELDLPFGFDCTIEYIKEIGEFFKISEKKVKAFIDKELNDNKIGLLKWGINRTLFDKNVSIFSDPYLVNGLIDIGRTIGLNLKETFIHGDLKHLDNNKNKLFKEIDNIQELLGKDIEDVDIFISNRSTRIDHHISEDKILEFGFPSYYYHCFTKQPTYGIKGSMNLVNRIYNNLSRI